MQIDKNHKSELGLINIDYYRVLPNRLTPVYSENHYKEENYLKVKTVVFKYITPPYSNGWYVRYMRYIRYVNRSHRSYRSRVPNHVTRLPLIPQFYWLHQSCIPCTNCQPFQVLFEYLYYPVYKVRNTRSLLSSFVLKDCPNLQVINQRCTISHLNLVTFIIPDASYQILSI